MKKNSFKVSFGDRKKSVQCRLQMWARYVTFNNYRKWNLVRGRVRVVRLECRTTCWLSCANRVCTSGISLRAINFKQCNCPDIATRTFVLLLIIIVFFFNSRQDDKIHCYSKLNVLCVSTSILRCCKKKKKWCS